MRPHQQSPTPASTHYSDRIWRWFRRRHAAVQVIGWLICWWLLLPLLIWRTNWNPKLKLALSAPFALFVLSALINGPQDQQPTDTVTQRSVAVVDTQPGGASQPKVSEKQLPSPTVKPRTGASRLLPTREPATAVSPTQVPPTEMPPTQVPPTPTNIPPTPLIPIAQITVNGNVRSYPSTESGQILSKVSAGETITLISKTPDGAWYEMTTASGMKGYVSATLLDVAPGVSEIVATRDAGPPPVVVRPPARPAAKPAVKPGGNCDPNYSGACIPNVSYDLDCGEIAAQDFYVVGYDKHRLDGDNDGIACES